jgi:ribosomal RNA-processing protein 1
VPLLTPFFNLNALSSVPTTHNRLHTALVTPLFGALLAHSKPQPSTPNYRSTVAAPALSPKDSDNQRRKRARIEPREPPLAALCKNACLAVSPGESDAHVALPPSEVRKGTLKAMFDIASGDDTKEISRKRMYRAWKEATELAEETERADDV